MNETKRLSGTVPQRRDSIESMSLHRLKGMVIIPKHPRVRAGMGRSFHKILPVFTGTGRAIPAHHGLDGLPAGTYFDILIQQHINIQ